MFAERAHLAARERRKSRGNALTVALISSAERLYFYGANDRVTGTKHESSSVGVRARHEWLTVGVKGTLGPVVNASRRGEALTALARIFDSCHRVLVMFAPSTLTTTKKTTGISRASSRGRTLP